MHFVVCIFGLLKSLSYTLPSMKKFCFDSIEATGNTYEVIVHSYRFAGSYTNLRNKENPAELNFSEYKLLNPSHVRVDDQDEFDRTSLNLSAYKTFGDPWNNEYQSMTNHIRALNSLYQVTLMLENLSLTKHIDGAIFLRPDVEYINELPVYLLPHGFSEPTVFIPDFHRSCDGGQFNDRMAMGDLPGAIAYGKKYEQAVAYSQIQPMHSESFTHYYLKVVRRLNVVEMPFRFRRVRATGQIHPRDAVVRTPFAQYNNEEPTTVPGRPKHSLILTQFYKFLESITFHRVYIWNHGDESNLECHPNVPYISYAQLTVFKTNFFLKKQLNSGSSSISGSSDSSSDSKYIEGFSMLPRISPQTKAWAFFAPIMEATIAVVALCMCVIFYSCKLSRTKVKFSRQV